MLLKTFYLVGAALSFANGAWMIFFPHAWYANLPGGVPDTGPFNPHLIRDLGVVFAVSALGFAWCAFNLARCLPVHTGLTAFFTGHAVLHVVDILTGRLPLYHWWMDAPLVFVPAIALILIALRPVWRVAPMRE